MSGAVGFEAGGDVVVTEKVVVVQKTQPVVKNAKSTYEIEKNHLNLIELQRRANFKRLQRNPKFQHCEMLHKLDETRRDVRKMIEAEKPDPDDPSPYPFKPHIDRTSREIMKNVDKDVLIRTYDWLQMKVDKGYERNKERQFKEEEDFKMSTMKHKPIPKSATATSRVRLFLETQQNNLNLTNTFKGEGGINNNNPSGVVQYTGFQGQPKKVKKKAVHTFLDPIAKKGPRPKGKNVLDNIGSEQKDKLGKQIGFYQGGKVPVDAHITDARQMKMKDFKKAVKTKLKDL